MAAFLAHMDRARREGPLQLFGPLATDGRLRPGLTADDAADIIFTLASPDTLRSLVVRCGWSQRRAVNWITRLLERELLPDG